MKIVENIDGKWITIPQDFNLSLILSNYSSASFIFPLEMEAFSLASQDTQQNLYKSFLSKKAELFKASDLLPPDAKNMKIHLERVFQSIESQLQPTP
ncbi:MAG: hypothetical protein V4654_02945 [Bdellovibrionota bacterium]